MSSLRREEVNMGSVIGEIKCPKCGGSMFYDFNYHTQEEFRMCNRCGFTQEWELLRNEDGTAKLSEDGKWVWDYVKTVGYGAVLLMPQSGVGCRYSFRSPLTEEDKAAVLKELQAENMDSSSYAILYDPESGKFTPLFGEMPGDYIDDEEVAD